MTGYKERRASPRDHWARWANKAADTNFNLSLTPGYKERRARPQDHCGHWTFHNNTPFQLKFLQVL
jgi:hypothetical protein